MSVRRVGNIWKVRHEHAQTGQKFEDDYEYVIVGNGHFSKPNVPNIPGEQLFKGSVFIFNMFRLYQNYIDDYYLNT